MINPKYTIGDILYISDYYDKCFVAIVDSIIYDRKGIRYIVKNEFEKTELSEGLTLSLKDEYECDAEPYFRIIKKVGQISFDD